MSGVEPPAARFGRYTVTGVLGARGAGGVYSATDLAGSTAALKLLDTSRVPREAVDRFLAEARVLEQLRHPHVVHAWDHGEAHGFVWYAMDLLPGGSLRDHVAGRGQIAVDHATALVFQVLLGLHAVHARGVVHRDVKLTNVLIDEDGNARLTDFGVARHPAGSVDFHTVPGEGLGTEGYGAPEQWDDTGRVGPRADVYAVGVLLYRLLTRRSPHQLHLGRYRPQLLDELAEPIRELILAASHPEQDERPPTARDLALALVEARDAVLGRTDTDRWMDGFATAAVTATDAFTPVRRWLRARP